MKSIALLKMPIAYYQNKIILSKDILRRGWTRSVQLQELREKSRKLFLKFWENFSLIPPELLLDHRLFGITGLKSEHRDSLKVML